MNKYILKRLLISVLYPNRCPFCGEIINDTIYYCKDCVKELNEYCGNADHTVYCFYDEKSKPFILSAKYGGNGYAISAAAYLMFNKLKERGILNLIDVIIPVPARKAALKERGYSFPSMLAKEIAEIANIRYSDKCLTKTRETAEQKDLGRAERSVNLQDSFGGFKESVEGLNVLVIDDVETTGATLDEVKKTLLQLDAKAVYCAVFAKNSVI